MIWNLLWWACRISSVQAQTDLTVSLDRSGILSWTNKVGSGILTIEKALEHNGPVLMHFKVEKQDNVFPMVPAGQALDQVIDMA